MRISVLILALTMAPAVYGGEAPFCSSLLYADAGLMKEVPDRLRRIVESARFRGRIGQRESAWAEFHGQLDAALLRPEERFIARIDDLQIFFSIHRTEKGELQLVIDGLGKEGARIGDVLEGGDRFLDFWIAELAWIAKARASGKLENGITLVGKELENERLEKALKTLGFRAHPKADARCVLLGVLGTAGGYGLGRLYFMGFDAGAANGSIYEEQRKFYRDVAAGTLAGAGGAVALGCFHRKNRDYSLRFHPAELPSLPAGAGSAAD